MAYYYEPMSTINTLNLVYLVVLQQRNILIPLKMKRGGGTKVYCSVLYDIINLTAYISSYVPTRICS